MAANRKALSHSASLHDNVENEKLAIVKKHRNGSITFGGTENVVLQTLSLFRREGEGAFCDAVLEVQGKCFAAHRNILAANSRFFYNMFTSGMSDSNERKIKLNSLKSKAVETILDFFYSRQITIMIEDIEDLLEVTSFLLVEPVKNACVTALVARIDSLKTCYVNHLAEKFCLTRLAKEAATDPVIVGVSTYKSFIYDFKSDVTREIDHEDEPDYIFGMDDDIEVAIQGSTIFAHNGYSKMLKYDVSNPRPHWEVIKSFPLDYRHCTFAALNGFLYVVYWFSHNDSKKKNNPVRCFDSHTNQWKVLPQLKCPRVHFKVIATEDKLFVLGGENTKDKIFAKNSVERYYPEEKKWSYVAPLQTPRRDPVAVYGHGKIYVAGGYKTTEDWRNNCWLSECEVYIPSSNQWHYIASLPLTSKFEVQGKLLIADNRIYTLQCISEGKSDEVDALEYHQEEDEWKEVTVFGLRDVSSFCLHFMHIRSVCQQHIPQTDTMRFFYSRITGDYIDDTSDDSGEDDVDDDEDDDGDEDVDDEDDNHDRDEDDDDDSDDDGDDDHDEDDDEGNHND